MTDDIEQLQSRLLAAIEERDDLATRAANVYRRAAETDTAFDLAHAQAFLLAEGTVEARKAHCVKATAEQKLTARIAEAEASAVKDRLRAYESTISALQSLLKLKVNELDSLKYGRSAGA